MQLELFHELFHRQRQSESKSADNPKLVEPAERITGIRDSIVAFIASCPDGRATIEEDSAIPCVVRENIHRKCGLPERTVSHVAAGAADIPMEGGERQLYEFRTDAMSLEYGIDRRILAASLRILSRTEFIEYIEETSIPPRVAGAAAAMNAPCRV